MCNFDGEVKNLGIVPEELLFALEDKLAKALTENPHFWMINDVNKPNKFLAFKGTTEHIVFKFPISTRTIDCAIEFPVYADWKNVIEPIIEKVVPQYGYAKGQVNRIMLAKLLPGKEIMKHIDGDISSETPHKIHVPLITNPKVEFWVNDNIHKLDRGFAYEVNNRVLHGGKNGGEQDRIHLIFDYFDRSILRFG